MRCTLLIVALAVGVAVVTPRAFQEPRAASDVLGDARQALGGASQLSRVKALFLSGTERRRNQLSGRAGRPIELVEFRFEVRVLMPSHYLERQERSSNGTASFSGFSGDVLLNRVELSPGTTGVAGYPADQLQREKETCSYLLLLLLLKTDSVLPLLLRGASGNTLTFDAWGKAQVTIDLDPMTRLPTRLHREIKTATGSIVQLTVDISQYSSVDSLLLPRKLRWFRNGELESEREFSRIELNPSLTASDFKR